MTPDTGPLTRQSGAGHLAVFGGQGAAQEPPLLLAPLLAADGDGHVSVLLHSDSLPSLDLVREQDGVPGVPEAAGGQGEDGEGGEQGEHVQCRQSGHH